jgi:hypothetical protein
MPERLRIGILAWQPDDLHGQRVTYQHAQFLALRERADVIGGEDAYAQLDSLDAAIVFDERGLLMRRWLREAPIRQPHRRRRFRAHHAAPSLALVCTSAYHLTLGMQARRASPTSADRDLSPAARARKSAPARRR